MTFLAPGFIFASLAVAAAIVGLHFIVTRQPRAGILPTARFVPDTRATTVARARRPSDLLVMLLRVLLVLAVGAALAKPMLSPAREAEARVILVDVSRSASDYLAIRDSARAIARPRDAIVLFDSSARLIAGNVSDTIGSLRPSNRRGNLSAALIGALRAGSSMRDRADSLELVIVSPFAKEELDAATDSIRKLWPGRARLVRVGAAAADTARVAGRLGINANADDPLAVTVALVQPGKTNGLIDRRGIDQSSAFSTAGGNASTNNPSVSGASLIEWPASGRPRFAVQRAVRDTVGGVIADHSVVVSAFNREWSFPSDSLRGAEVIARWVDGEPAAMEKPDGAGCVRSVAIPASPVGDLVIRKDFVRFVEALSQPCAAKTALIPADPNAVAKLEGKGGLAPRGAFQPVTDAHSAIAPWLLALAMAAAIAELFVRQCARDTRALGAADRHAGTNEARAA